MAGGHLPEALALDTPSTCLTSELESLELEKLFQGPTLGTPRQRLLDANTQGAGQHRVLQQARTMAILSKPPHSMRGVADARDSQKAHPVDRTRQKSLGFASFACQNCPLPR